MMNSGKQWRGATGAALLVAVTGLAGCYGPVYYHEAPPPHAPAYGYRWHPNDYFFYPSVGVYFNVHSGYYYYREGPDWRRSRTLPRQIIILPRERVHIRVPDKNPWQRFREHEDRYRPRTQPPRLPDQERHMRDRVEREQNSRLYREERDWELRKR